MDKITYDHRERKYHAFTERIRFNLKKLILFKFIILIGGLGITITLYIMRYSFIGTGALIFVFSVYQYLNIQHDKKIYYENLVNNLIKINQNGVKRLNGAWTSFSDNGDELKDPEHFYSGDLDILGQGSIFQYINSCTTTWGRKKLKSLLSTHPDDVQDIQKRQEAICELSRHLSFRQHLQGEGMSMKENTEKMETLVEWGQKVNEKLLAAKTRRFIQILPILTLVSIILGYFGVTPYIFPVILILFQGILLKWNGKERAKTLNTAYAFKYHLEPFQNIFKQIERRKFTSLLLVRVKATLYKKNTPPSEHLARLNKICGNISNRNNMFYFLFNLLSLWDYRCEISLEKWKNECGKYLFDWFDGIGTFEALSSLSVLKYENPDWAVPELKRSTDLFVKASEIGHPLISTGRVVNDIELGNHRKVVLVTGSNMSGKSTFLRTLGLNLVLSYAGAPVCAESLSCSIMNIYTCMRVSDNLVKNISSFYAELLRIKMIVEAVKNKGSVFFLLDEIFKGTNSYDRHDAASVLITKLSKGNSIGLVSTHDLELEILEKKTGGKVTNYHFQEYYDQGKILFDYKLRPGASRTRNAIYLIRALGINLE